MTSINADLVFEQPPADCADLIFGGHSFVPPRRLAGIAVAVAAVQVQALASQPVRVVAMLLVSGVTVQAQVCYDNRVLPYRDCRCLVAHQAARPNTHDQSNHWGLSQSQRKSASLPWQVAHAASAGQSNRSKQSQLVGAQANALHRLALQHSLFCTALQQSAWFIHRSSQSAYTTAEHMHHASQSGMQAGVFHSSMKQDFWQLALSRVTHRYSPSGKGIANRGVHALQSSWVLAGLGRAGRSSNSKPLPPTPQPVPQWVDTHLLFQCLPISWLAGLVFGGKSPCDGQITPTRIVAVRRVYMVLNHASLRRIDGDVPLPVISLSCSLDVDSWTWGLNAVLSGEAWHLLQPRANLEPIALEATLNGYRWRWLLERMQRSRSFGKAEVRIQGRGVSALLDSPYAPVQTYSNSQARTARQLMADVLTVNGASIGWDLEWNIEDWLVPAAVFSHQGSAISALQRITAAVGAYLQPHPTLDLIRVLPRYPLPPWQWQQLTPDYVLTADVASQETLQLQEKPHYNRVFVSGESVGVLGQVTRSGTAGDVLAPMVVDRLITATEAARQRGLAVLSDTGRQMEVGLRLPVLDDIGIIVPGALVQYDDRIVTTNMSNPTLHNQRIGIVRSVQVEVGLPEVWQTLGVQTYA
jgi:hypothetical protein